MSIRSTGPAASGDTVSVDLQRILGFHLVTADLARLTGFYRDVLGFAADGAARPIDAAEMALLGLAGHGRRQMLRIGAQIVALDAFDIAGRPYPAGSDAASLGFQHLALVVADIASAHARLRDVAPISLGGPQHLPPASGGGFAFKFRDTDGHPLELLQFPPDATPAHWHGRAPRAGEIALGIDHSAISVASTDASTTYYAALGLRRGQGTRNTGAAQDHLDHLPGVKVQVAPMIPDVATPHLELLGYRVPRPKPSAALRPNDIAATRIRWQGGEAGLLRDPDGHFHQVDAGAREMEPHR